MRQSGRSPRGFRVGRSDMPLLFFLLIVLLIAQIGFWHTLGAIIGAVLMIILLVLLLVAVIAVGFIGFVGRLGRGPRYERYR